MSSCILSPRPGLCDEFVGKDFPFEGLRKITSGKHLSYLKVYVLIWKLIILIKIEVHVVQFISFKIFS